VQVGIHADGCIGDGEPDLQESTRMSSIKTEYDAAVARITAPGAPFELVNATIDGVDYRLYRNAPRSLAEVFAQATAHGDSEFLVYEGERWSFAQLLAQGARIAHALHRHCGIRPGDRVAIAMRNYPEWMSAFIGIATLGAVAVPLNSWGQARELAFALDDAGARAVFCDQQRCDQLAAHLAATGLPAIVARPSGAGLPGGSAQPRGLHRRHRRHRVSGRGYRARGPALMMYTSGTTGTPKGAPVDPARGVPVADELRLPGHGLGDDQSRGHRGDDEEGLPAHAAARRAAVPRERLPRGVPVRASRRRGAW
jgi:long-chain acyl-CoA synthetase